MKTIPRNLIPLLFVAVSLVLAGRALAGDSLHQVCVGQVKIDKNSASSPDGTEKLAVLYDEQRAPDGKSRKVTLAMTYGDKTYAGTGTTDTLTAKVVLRNVSDANDVLFEGTVEGLKGAAGVKVVGNYITFDKKPHRIRTTLRGYDIPYRPASQDAKAGKTGEN